MPSTWSNTSVDISLDNLSPLAKMQKSAAPSVYQLQQQRTGTGGGIPHAGSGGGMVPAGETSLGFRLSLSFHLENRLLNRQPHFL